MSTLTYFFSLYLSQAATKPTVTYYPSIVNDQAQIKDYGIRQLGKFNLKVNKT